jgi:hypothetical protein
MHVSRHWWQHVRHAIDPVSMPSDAQRAELVSPLTPPPRSVACWAPIVSAQRTSRDGVHSA